MVVPVFQYEMPRIRGFGKCKDTSDLLWDPTRLWQLNKCVTLASNLVVLVSLKKLQTHNNLDYLAT